MSHPFHEILKIIENSNLSEKEKELIVIRIAAVLKVSGPHEVQNSFQYHQENVQLVGDNEWNNLKGFM